MPIINLIYNKKTEPLPNYLCFTANTAGSTISLTKVGSPATVTLEKSSDGSKNMFQNTGGSWTGTPSVNTTYYTSNTVV